MRASPPPRIVGAVYILEDTPPRYGLGDRYCSRCNVVIRSSIPTKIYKCPLCGFNLRQTPLREQAKLAKQV